MQSFKFYKRITSKVFKFKKNLPTHILNFYKVFKFIRDLHAKFSNLYGIYLQSFLKLIGTYLQIFKIYQGPNWKNFKFISDQ